MNGKNDCSTISTVCVFCASSDNIGKAYTEAAWNIGRGLARGRFTLIYGGGNNGLMGVIAEAVHEHGGTVVGVIPRFFQDMGYAYDRADELIVVDDMRQRKTIMETRAGAFIVLPGGFGTLEELLEIITLRQIGAHDKPVVVVNLNGFFNHLIAQFNTGIYEKFIKEEYSRLFHVVDTAEAAITYIAEMSCPPVE